MAIQPYVEQADKPPEETTFLTASSLSGSASLAILERLIIAWFFLPGLPRQVNMGIYQGYHVRYDSGLTLSGAIH
jgi:hypothetical protein